MLKNVDLSKYTRFRAGGVAENFFEPETQEELISFLKNKDYAAPLNVLGAGSNLLVMDGLIKGSIICTKKLNKIYKKDDNIITECGATTTKLFNFAKNSNVGGFEFLACIPGTVGGACKTNAGCYGSEIKDLLVKIKVVDFNGNVKFVDIDECGMSYRANNLPENFIYLEAYFKANQNATKEVIESKFNEMLLKKKASQPLDENTCGSTFKNVSDDLPAWKIIQRLGLQGVDFNGVKFSEKHANFLINCNNTKSENILNLINLAKNKAKSELKIDLELEIKIMGNKNE